MGPLIATLPSAPGVPFCYMQGKHPMQGHRGRKVHLRNVRGRHRLVFKGLPVKILEPGVHFHIQRAPLQRPQPLRWAVGQQALH